MHLLTPLRCVLFEAHLLRMRLLTKCQIDNLALGALKGYRVFKEAAYTIVTLYTLHHCDTFRYNMEPSKKLFGRGVSTPVRGAGSRLKKPARDGWPRRLTLILATLVQKLTVSEKLTSFPVQIVTIQASFQNVNFYQ